MAQTPKTIDVVAAGTCYVDTNVDNFPFSRQNLIGEELIGKRYETVPGGSAVNFCRLGHTLGLQTAFIGMAGNDQNGDTLQRLLTQQGVHSTLIRRPDLLTNIGFNITNPEGEHLMFIAGTANAALSPSEVLPKLEELLPQARMLYLGGCLKLTAFTDAFEEIAHIAAQNSTKLVVDHGRVPDMVSDELLESVRNLVLHASYYFPSREEFCTLWNVPDITAGLEKLTKLAPQLTVVVKDGSHGAFYWKNGSMQHAKAENVDTVINATGAGDSFNVGVITALLQDSALSNAVAYGCRVAAAKLRATDFPTLL